MVNQPQFDVFLAHNSEDKPQVRAIAQQLKQRELKYWIDEEQIPPGRPFQDLIQQGILLAKSAAIFIGPVGLGRWQVLELRSFISQLVDAGKPVIPVLLPGIIALPEDLLFLKELNWVGFTNGIDDVEALDNLEWGITGQKPEPKSSIHELSSEHGVTGAINTQTISYSETVTQVKLPGEAVAAKQAQIPTFSETEFLGVHSTQQNSNIGSSPRWDDNLEGAARRIAETDRSPLRVFAGPGTGKTFALMRRVARLVENGASPSRILVCTFTRTAARDLRREVSALGVEGARAVFADTLHAYCFSILFRTEVLQLTGRVPRPLLKFEERFLLEDLKKENSFGGVRECEERLRAFNAAWARLHTDEPGWPADPTDHEFHQVLQGWLHFHKAMLIGELVPETLRYLRENPASNDRNAFDHVLVDEYQDLNRAEQELLDLLAEAGTLTLIGDEDQSIYSFKYAHPEGIATFKETHPDTHDENLQVCHRCRPLVVEIANHLIANNTSRNPRILQSINGQPRGDVYVVQWQTTQKEAEGIARFIHKRVMAGEVEAGRVLVLAPRRQFGYAIRDALKSLGIPAHSFFHEEALDGNPKKLLECQAQEAFSLLTLLANPEDRVALRCWCGFGSDSLRSGAWGRLRAHCEQTGESPRTALEHLASGSLKITASGELVNRFKKLEAKLAELIDLRGIDLVNALFPDSEDWTRPFRSIASPIEEADSEEKADFGEKADFDASKLRKVLRMGVTQPELPTDVDYVRVMSLHKSKGLTADLVIVAGCIEGLIPLLADNLPEAERLRSLEEQRRLFYVAITRAKRILLLSSVTQLPRKDAYKMGIPFNGGDQIYATTITSRFVAELGPSRPRAILGDDFLRITGSL